MRPPKPHTLAAQMILDYMQDVGLTRPALCKKLKISQSLFDKIISGNRALTWRVARVIERGSQQALVASELMDAAEDVLPKEKKTHER